jgi:hypothetical protein
MLPDPGERGRRSGRTGNAPRFPPGQRPQFHRDRFRKRNRGQRPTRRAGSARRGRGGRWPGALAPGGPGISGALWQGRWPLPWQRRWRFGFRSSAPSSGGNRKRMRFPRPRRTLPQRPIPPAPSEASARPGGREAPAGGGAGAGRGLWAPGWPSVTVRKWQGRWPLPLQRGWWFGLRSSGVGPGRTRKRMRFPARARQCHQDPCNPHQQRPAPAGGGAGAGRGLWAPGGRGVSVALWQGRWPLPELPGIPACSGPPSLRAGTGNAPRFPRPRGTLPPRPVPPTPTEASARPGGREAPAGSGRGAGRGVWPPAGG